MYASLKHAVESAKLLLDRGAETKIQNKDGLTCLHIATKVAEVDMVNLLIEADQELCTIKSKAGRLPIHIACAAGKLDAVVTLLRAMQDRSGLVSMVETQDHGGSTPLIEACSSGNVQVVQELIQHGANVMKQDYNGKSPAHAAAIRGSWNALQCLLDACKCCGLKALQLRDNQGVTPLLAAIQTGNRDVALRLLDAGIEATCDGKGRSAIEVAKLWERSDLVAILTAKFKYEKQM